MPTLQETRFSPPLSRAIVMRLLATTLLALAASGPASAQGAAGFLTHVLDKPTPSVSQGPVRPAS
jgi:hypothetical protein